MSPQKHVVFDVVGTCVSFDAFHECIDAVLGPKLREHTITPQHFGHTWQVTAELEYTFLSIQGNYKPYKDVLRGLFYRTLFLCGVPNPRTVVTDDQRERCMEGYTTLKVRPECQEAFKILRDNGFTVWCFTAGDVQRVRGYFERANMDMPLENFVSCDFAGVAKPSPDAYRVIWDRLGANDIKWFAAAHMWDVTSATKVGFRGAWSSVLEKEPSLDVYSESKLEVVEGSLVDMVNAIVAKSS